MTRFICWMKLWLFLGSSLSVLAQDTLVIEAPVEHQVRPNRKQRVINWLHFRHSPKYLGPEDPKLPRFVDFRPVMVPLPDSYSLPKSFVVANDELDLRSLTPKILESLDQASLKALLAYLASIPAEIKYRDARGKVVSGKKRKLRSHHFKKWELSNSASALAFTMATQYELELFVRMASLVPEAIFPSLHGNLRGIIDPNLLALIMADILIDIDEAPVGTAAEIAKKIGQLVRFELGYWVAKDPRMLSDYLGQIVDKCAMVLEEQNLKNKEKALGLLIGSVVGGSLMHVEHIKDIDEKRIWIVGVISNLIWAATAFVGVVPVSAPIAAAIAGGISFGSVVSAAVYTVLNYPRDYFSNVREIQGRLEMALLEAGDSPDKKPMIEYAKIPEWIRAAIHSIGQHD